jgi:hypothetical protein
VHIECFIIIIIIIIISSISISSSSSSATDMMTVDFNAPCCGWECDIV